jgi:biotin carboxyl carrier protein
VRRSTAAAAQESESGGDLRAPMPGQVLLVPATVGDAVRAGEPVVVLESMKMELVMAAPIDGTVAELNVAVGDKVVVDQPLARVEAAA